MNCPSFKNKVILKCTSLILILSGIVAGAIDAQDSLNEDATDTHLLATAKGQPKWKWKWSKGESNQPLDGIAKFPIPFHVSIQHLTNGTYEHSCAGSIIDEAFVLTAAHCFYAEKDPQLLRVVAGSNTLSKGSRHNVSKVIIHDFFQPLMGRDIALLKVKPKFTFDGKEIDKIDFNATAPTKANVKGYLIGWGRTKGNPDKRLEMVSFRTISTEECRERGFIHISSTELCAVSDKGRGACDGDSGGPLVTSKFDLQIGILSYGRTPCRRGRIYAFTYMHPLVEWIKKQIRKIS